MLVTSLHSSAAAPHPRVPAPPHGRQAFGPATTSEPSGPALSHCPCAYCTASVGKALPPFQVSSAGRERHRCDCVPCRAIARREGAERTRARSARSLRAGAWARGAAGTPARERASSVRDVNLLPFMQPGFWGPRTTALHRTRPHAVAASGSGQAGGNQQHAAGRH